MKHFLPLLLDAPLQSWGFSSRFQRRTTGLHPTKSGVLGMLCAAMGIGKGTDAERETLPQLAALQMTSIALARNYPRMEDFHTVGGGYDKETQQQNIPRKASGGPCDNPTVTHRQYLADARFGIILAGHHALLERVAAALQNPVWGIWFGRKSCIPAAPVLVSDADGASVFAGRRGAFEALLHAEAKLRRVELPEPLPDESSFTRVEEVDGGTDSYNDQPVSFGRDNSSSEGRAFAVRRVRLDVGRT